MNVVWTDEATDDLQDIFGYYTVEASRQVAEKMIAGLIEATQLLVHQPNMGQKEPLLSDRKSNFRYLVKGNYKIIYWIDAEEIYVAAVFDCRQNPEKMKAI